MLHESVTNMLDFWDYKLNVQLWLNRLLHIDKILVILNKYKYQLLALWFPSE